MKAETYVSVIATKEFPITTGLNTNRKRAKIPERRPYSFVAQIATNTARTMLRIMENMRLRNTALSRAVLLIPEKKLWE